MKDKQAAVPSLENHELAELFPPISPDELAELSESIKANGLRQPILVFGGKIVDGRNRYAACLMAGVTPVTRELPAKANLLEVVIDANLRRRHLDTGQRAMIAAQLANKKVGRPSNPETTGIPVISQSEAAEKFSVSTDSVQQAAVVLSSNDPVIIDEVRNGNLSVNAAANRVRETRSTGGEGGGRGMQRVSSAGPPPVLTHDQEYPPSQPINVRFSRKDTSSLITVMVKQFTSAEIRQFSKDLLRAAAEKGNDK